MYKTTYRLRVYIEDKALSLPLQICVYQDKTFRFQEMVDKIRRMASQHQQQLSMADYNITIDNHKHGRTVVHDDRSLSGALKLLSDRHYIELTLQRKRARTLSPPAVYNGDSLARLPRCTDDVPVIKPTVLRWVPAEPTEMLPGHPPLSFLNEDPSFANRKDSGISLEEPLKKKARVMSTDLGRKLPEPHASSPRSLAQSYMESTSSSSSSSSSPATHPLDLRRPSTAPPSPLMFFTPGSPIKLPAIASITSASDSVKLAPIYAPEPRSPPQTPLSGTTSCTPSPSSSCSSASFAAAPTHTASAPHRAAKHRSRQPKSPGQFLCEHLCDKATGRICGQTFRRSYDLSRHQTIHLKNRPFCFCNQCGKKFTRMDALRRHERVQGHATKAPDQRTLQA